MEIIRVKLRRREYAKFSFLTISLSYEPSLDLLSATLKDTFRKDTLQIKKTGSFSNTKDMNCFLCECVSVVYVCM